MSLNLNLRPRSFPRVDLRFFIGGALTKYICYFSEKLVKLKRNWFVGGGGAPGVPLGSVTDSFCNICCVSPEIRGQ